jgi:hypothetical protein
MQIRHVRVVSLGRTSSHVIGVCFCFGDLGHLRTPLKRCEKGERNGAAVGRGGATLGPFQQRTR